MRGGPAVLLALMLATTTALAEVPAFVETTAPAPKGHDPMRPAWPVAARLNHPTDIYDHDILGGIQPFTVLEVDALACGACRHGHESAAIRLPGNLVFEDVVPRLWDVTGDSRPEIVVVETDVTKGARLAIWSYSDTGADLTRLAATPFIGTRHRWLAPVGAADFDGDGQIEIAYVDRPHLVRDLVMLRLNGTSLREVYRLPGFTAHRIGDTTISSAVRTCADGSAELLLPDADWMRLLTVRDGGGALVTVDEGPMTDSALAKAAARPCR